MIDIIADLHLHGKYSRAVSPQMIPSVMGSVGKQKGLQVLATGDWTHPIWFREIRSQLVESEEGLYRLKDQGSKINDKNSDVRFLLSVEIATIYSQGGKGRRIHNLVWVPSFETAEKVNKELIKRGFNLSSDGRPIIGLSSRNLLQLLLEIDERNMLIPAHIWTPWFGVYGKMSGFESLEEAFGDLSRYIYGIETGLSSDPQMNWQVKELNTRSILSFSDAHSPAKMGREATIFRLEELSYENIRAAVMAPSLRLVPHPNPLPKGEGDQGALVNKVLYTVEFYPEEGKYHYSGHRNCNISYTPEEISQKGNICPVCHKPLTDGVMRRVQELADEKSGIRNHELKAKPKQNKQGLQWLTDPQAIRPPFVKLVPLNEIIAESIGSPVGSPKVKLVFDELCKKLGGELEILLKVESEKIVKTALIVTSEEFAKKIAEGVERVRKGNIVIKPGFDGLYGVVKIWSEEMGPNGSNNTDGPKEKEEKKEQIGIQF